MIQSKKGIFETDEIKFTLVLSNNGLGHFEQKYSFKVHHLPAAPACVWSFSTSTSDSDTALLPRDFSVG